MPLDRLFEAQVISDDQLAVLGEPLNTFLGLDSDAQVVWLWEQRRQGQHVLALCILAASWPWLSEHVRGDFARSARGWGGSALAEWKAQPRGPACS